MNIYLLKSRSKIWRYELPEATEGLCNIFLQYIAKWFKENQFQSLYGKPAWEQGDKWAET